MDAEGAPAPTSGNAPWVVRHRVALTWGPALLFLLCIVWFQGLLRDDGLGELLENLGFVLVMVGSMGRVWCALYIAGRKNRELCVDGPYSLCRNPLYVFSYVGLMGLALGAKNVLLAVGATPLFWAYYAVVIRSEEKVLQGIFGTSFDEYRQRVPAVFPRISNYWSRKEFLIQPKKVVAGMVDAMWFLWAMILLEGLEHVKEVYFNR